MGLRERLQAVTQFLEKAATKGRQLRADDERDERQAPSAGEQDRQREERRLGGMSAEDRDRQAQSGAAKTPTDE